MVISLYYFSTLSSVLNSLSAVTLTDYIKPLFPHLSDQKAKTLSKILGRVQKHDNFKYSYFLCYENKC